MKELENVLRKEYGHKINISHIAPMHDEDFKECYVICHEDVVICRADTGLKYICESIERYYGREK